MTSFDSMRIPEIIVTHIPTGISCKTQCYRDVEAARKICMKVLRAKIAAASEAPIHHFIIEHGNGEDMQLAVDEYKYGGA